MFGPEAVPLLLLFSLSGGGLGIRVASSMTSSVRSLILTPSSSTSFRSPSPLAPNSVAACSPSSTAMFSTDEAMSSSRLLMFSICSSVTSASMLSGGDSSLSHQQRLFASVPASALTSDGTKGATVDVAAGAPTGRSSPTSSPSAVNTKQMPPGHSSSPVSAANETGV